MLGFLTFISIMLQNVSFEILILDNRKHAKAPSNGAHILAAFEEHSEMHQFKTFLTQMTLVEKETFKF